MEYMLGSKSKIKNTILHSDNDVDKSNNEELFKYYQLLIRLRHDLLHYIVLESLKKEWSEEKSVRVYFNLQGDTNPILDRTPDIIHKYEEKIFLIDVSISRDISTSSKIKTDKYVPVCSYLTRILGVESVFLHINVQTSTANLEQELHKIQFMMKKPPDIHFFNECIKILEEKKRNMSQYIDKEYFEKRKIESFSSDELKYEKYGYTPDLDINSEKFKEFNNTFPFEENVEEVLSLFNENELVEGLNQVLNDETNPIYTKYKDNVCSETQFIDAFTTIKKKNEILKMKEPKPTHHIMIPFYEDFKLFQYEINEQKQNIQFFDYILKTKFTGEDKRLLFLKELAEKHNNLFLNKEKEINEECYDTGQISKDDVIFTQLYKLLKKIVRVKLAYHNDGGEKKTKFKLSKKDKIELDIYKENKQERIKELLQIYEEYSKKYDLSKFMRQNYSFRNFLSDQLGFTLEEEFVLKQKTIKLSKQNCSNNFNEYWKKTGINVNKNMPDVSKWEVTDSITFDYYKDIEKTISYLQEPCNVVYKDDDLFKYHYTYDSEYANTMKKEMVNAYQPYLTKIKNTKTYNYLKNSHNVAQQLVHYSLLNLKPMSFSIFNAGIPNALYIVAGCYNKVFSEDGKPFCCVILTKTPEKYNSFFGKHSIIKCENSEYFLIISNWRRLPTSKLTHMRDAYYSVLSSTMNSMLSNNNVESVNIPGKYERIFATRAIISLSTNQRIAEFLMDARYAYMSAFSTHTNINKLFIEKFGPPYRTSFEIWLVHRLLTRLHIIYNHANNENIKLKRPEYNAGLRSNSSIGGEIYLPSLWGDYILGDVTEVLDEAFIYVHTMKEPSNIFHEQVKAMDVIVTFQKEYDDLPDYIKFGKMKNWEEIQKYLLYPTKIGFSAAVIHHSTKNTINMEKPNFRRIVDEINNESVGELISTKAVISDIEREIVESDMPTKRQLNKHLKKMRTYLEERDFEKNKEEIKVFYLKTHSKYYSERKPRQRVIETILDYITEHKNIERTIDVANHFITNEKGHVVADICIKAQYGSKREFYVINIGAKGLARCTENFFKKISENSPNEAISVPGDRKILEMQRMLDRIFITNPMSEKYKLKYVNGDCTKWSAAETMGSFISMTTAMKEHIPENMYQLLIATFNSWSKKEIQVPIDIYNKVIPPTLLKYKELIEKLKYLTLSDVRQKGRFISTQNFLQGMFNYASSYKAVCCSNYTYRIWKKIYPNKKLFMEHLEHSDDYVMVLVYEDEKDFEKFRVLHKIMMRLHGFNDSDRKTNCQSYFMEFVSQLSFNGVTLYPQIKKSKEVNLSLPCVGFKQDIDSAYSRIGECMRVGCNQTFLYFFQRLHMICVGEAYSILPNMYNNMYTMKRLLNTPIEFFGLPDTLPLFTLFCKGCGNNYRLWKYGDDECKNKIIYLYKEAKKVTGVEEFLSEDLDYTYSLFTPKFLYEVNNKGMDKLQNVIQWSPDELKAFWEEHISYKFLKPKNNILLTNWIKSMFFNRSFLEAYTKASRTKMTMRISHFVRAKIVKLFIRIDELKNKYDMLNQNTYTMKSYQQYINNEYQKMINNNNQIQLTKEEEIQVLKIITKCDATYSAIYSILDNIRISKRIPRKRNLIQIATKVPAKITSFTIVNDPSILLQYLYNQDDFMKDNRTYVSLYSLEQDIVKMRERIPQNLLTSKNTMDVLSVYNDMMITKDKQLIMMGHDRTSKQLIYVIEDIMRFNYLPFYDTNTIINDIIHVIDPFTNKILFSKGHKITPDMYQQNLENICLLYTYFTYKEKFDNHQLKNLFKNIRFQISDNEIATCQEILNQFSPKYCDQFEVSLELQKIAAYLNASMFGNNELLDHLVESIYTYSYHYEIQGEYSSGKYHGETMGYFTNFRKIYKFHLLPNNKMFLMSDSPKINLFPVHYNIALRLIGELGEELFQNTMYKNRLQNISLGFDNEEQFRSFLKREKIVGLYKIKENKYNYINYKEAKFDEEYIPIFRTTTSPIRGVETKKTLLKLSPTVNELKLSVYVGREKMFMLPFWKCKTYHTMVFFEKVFENYNIEVLMNQRIIQNYLTNKEISTTISEIPHQTDLDEIIIEYINKNKLYHFIDEKLFKYITDNVNNQECYECAKKILLPKTEQLLTPKLDKLHFKKQEKSLLNENIETIETVQDLSKLDMSLDLDFIVEDDDAEFGLFEEEEDLDNLPITVKNIPVKEFLLTDFIVEKPVELKIKKQKTMQRQNYLLKQIDNQLPINVLLLLNSYVGHYNASHVMDICQYLENLKLHFEKLEKIFQNKTYENNMKAKYALFFSLYELLTNSYLKTTKSEIFKVDYYETSVVFLKKTIVKDYTQTQYEKVKNSQKVYEHKIENNYLLFLSIIDPIIFLKEYKQQFGCVFQPFYLEQYSKMVVEITQISVETDIFDDL